jgi:hypothetical protein
MKMGRSGYTEDDDDPHNLGYLYRGAVKRAIEGYRGQAFLKDLLRALDALPEKRLIADSLRQPTGEVCTLGAIGVHRGLDMSGLISDPDEEPDDGERADDVARLFGIAPALAKEIMYENDESGPSYWGNETPESRFARMRKWVVENIKPDDEQPERK